MRIVSNCPNCQGKLDDIDTFDADMGTIVCPSCGSILRRNLRRERALKLVIYVPGCSFMLFLLANLDRDLPDNRYWGSVIGALIVSALIPLLRAKWKVDLNPQIVRAVQETGIAKPRTCPACGYRVPFVAYYAFRRSPFRSAHCPSCLTPITVNPNSPTIARSCIWVGGLLSFLIGVPVFAWASTNLSTPSFHVSTTALAFMFMISLSYLPAFWSYNRDPLIHGNRRSSSDAFIAMLADAKSRSDRRQAAKQGQTR